MDDPHAAWPIPQTCPELDDRQLHVWRIPTCGPVERDLEHWLEILSPAERARASRFKFAADRRRFVVRHAIQRRILAAYAAMAPADLCYAHGQHGKPRLALPSSALPLSLNSTHSSQLSLLAIARHTEVGVDIERLRSVSDFQAIANRFFAQREQQELARLDAEQRLEGFFNCWTRKEAIVKLDGQGISAGLDRFAVALRPGEPARVLWADVSFRGAVLGSLYDLRPGTGYVGAVAARDEVSSVCCWSWSETLAANW